MRAAIAALHNLLRPTANPKNPSEVRVSRPSEVLAAKAAADKALAGLLVGLGAVALLVGRDALDVIANPWPRQRLVLPSLAEHGGSFAIRYLDTKIARLGSLCW